MSLPLSKALSEMPPTNLKEKISGAYSDLENLQSELKKLKDSTISMTSINHKIDQSLDRNQYYNKHGTNSTRSMVNLRNDNFRDLLHSNSQAEMPQSKF